MRLLAPQRIRELLELAEAAGFSKADFSVEERDSRTGRGQRVNVIRYRDTQYYFAFEYTIVLRPRPGVSLPCVEYSPGINRLVETTLPVESWQTEVRLFGAWLQILKNEIQQRALEAAAMPIDFTREERVQIYYVARDFLEPNDRWPYRIDDPGEPMEALEEALKRQLSRLSIGDDDPDGNIKGFLLSAPYDDVLTVLQVLPLVPLLIADRYRPGFARPDWDEGFARLSRGICPVINDILEKTSSPARFTENLEFHREGLATSAPTALLRLPNREVLFRDLRGALQKSPPVSVVFLDLDGFKQVNDRLGHAAGDRCLESVADTLGAISLHRG